MAEKYLTVLILLLMAHAVTDLALQSEAMAKGKNRNRKPENVPPGQKPTPVWGYWMAAHVLTNAAGVYVVTHSIGLATLEAIAHAAIDLMKCENITNPHEDQALHLMTKMVEALGVVVGV